MMNGKFQKIVRQRFSSFSLTFAPVPMCWRSEPPVHFLCGGGPRLTLTPPEHYAGTESPPQNNDSYTVWSRDHSSICQTAKYTIKLHIFYGTETCSEILKPLKLKYPHSLFFWIISFVEK